MSKSPHLKKNKMLQHYLLLTVTISLSFLSCAGEGSSLRFFVIGDWGGSPLPPYSTKIESAVATEMGKIADMINPEFIMALGDNFYFTGVKNVDDPRFENTYEKVYTAKSLMVPWYILAGNHDHYGNVSAEIAYTERSERWNFPDYYYTKTWNLPDSKVTVQVLMVDTVILCGNTKHDFENDQPKGPASKSFSDQQWAWIEKTLEMSTADYLLVAGHFPVWSIAEHGPTSCLVSQLKPLLEKYQVNAYFSGHDHNLQHIKEDSSSVEYFVSGCADIINTSTEHKDSVPNGSSKFFWADASKLGGFASVQATSYNMTVTFLDSFGNELYQRVLKQRTLHG